MKKTTTILSLYPSFLTYNKDGTAIRNYGLSIKNLVEICSMNQLPIDLCQLRFTYGEVQYVFPGEHKRQLALPKQYKNCQTNFALSVVQEEVEVEVEEVV